jgi:hypothetical protein
MSNDFWEGYEPEPTRPAPMTKDEVLDLALEALEYIHEGANNQGPHTGISWRCVAVKAEPAIKAIKQARALDKKAENARELGLDYEPVAQYSDIVSDGGLDPRNTTPPAAQRTWVGLTHEEVMDSWDEIRDGDWAPDFYAVIEAKLKERNV